MKNKFNEGKKLSWEIHRKTWDQITRQTGWQTYWQAYWQTYGQITSYTKEALDEK